MLKFFGAILLLIFSSATFATNLIYYCRNGSACDAASAEQSYCTYYTGSNYKTTSVGGAPYYPVYFQCYQPSNNTWVSYPSPINAYTSCDSGYTVDPTTGECITINQSTCNSLNGTSLSSGYYDLGTDPTTPMTAAGCQAQNGSTSSGCMAVFSGTAPAATRLVNGVTHYFAKGQYSYVVLTCNPSTDKAVSSSASALPSDTCGTGQTMGQVNGQNVCVDVSTGTPATPVPTQSSSSCDTVSNADGSSTQTCTTQNADGSTTTTTKTTSSSGSSTQTTTTTGGGGAGGGSTSPTQPPETFTGPSTSADGIYTSNGMTMTQVLGNFQSAVQATAVYKAATGFWQVTSISGSCPAWSIPATAFSPAVPLDMFCSGWALSAYGMVKGALLILAAYVAFRWAFL